MGVFTGLQITESRISGLVLEKDKDGLKIMSRFEADFSDPDSMAAELHNCALEFASFPSTWSVGLPSIEFSFRHLTFPFKNRGAVRSALAAELETHLPYSAEEIEALPYFLSSEGDETNVLACAIRKERLGFYTDLLKNAGITPDVITPNVCALMPFHEKILSGSPREGINGSTLVVDINGNSAELFLKGDGGLIDFYTADCSENEIERFLKAYGKQPDSVFVGGKDAESVFIPGAESAVWKEELRGSIEGGANADETIIPLGLAAASFPFSEGFNFSTRAASTAKIVSALRFAAIGAVGCVILWIGSLAYLNSVKSRQLETAKAEIARVFKTVLPNARMVKAALQLKQETKRLEKKLRHAGMGESGRIDFLWVLKIISETIPQEFEIEMDQITYGLESISLEGKTGKFETVNEIRDKLGENDLFSKVEVTDTRISVDGEKVSFKIRIKL